MQNVQIYFQIILTNSECSFLSPGLDAATGILPPNLPRYSPQIRIVLALTVGNFYRPNELVKTIPTKAYYAPELSAGEAPLSLASSSLPHLPCLATGNAESNVPPPPPSVPAPPPRSPDQTNLVDSQGPAKPALRPRPPARQDEGRRGRQESEPIPEGTATAKKTCTGDETHLYYTHLIETTHRHIPVQTHDYHQ
ncbi:hypothetical protein E2C01_080552 [Portunus trituberculatus]|uniref:Uncharacterized protein n=1 Tax=Portunus trituberculatus TaxID=210409 RepID=A0A5B7IK05_PORTR|nr:hypothetical protein [Portunus trituberculatus]